VSREYVDFNTVSLRSYGFVVKFHLGISFPLASKKESRNTNIMATLQLDEIHKFSSLSKYLGYFGYGAKDLFDPHICENGRTEKKERI
jgi:hypothetical protein